MKKSEEATHVLPSNEHELVPSDRPDVSVPVRGLKTKGSRLDGPPGRGCKVEHERVVLDFELRGRVAAVIVCDPAHPACKKSEEGVRKDLEEIQEERTNRER